MLVGFVFFLFRFRRFLIGNVFFIYYGSCSSFGVKGIEGSLGLGFGVVFWFLFIVGLFVIVYFLAVFSVALYGFILEKCGGFGFSYFWFFCWF